MNQPRDLGKNRSGQIGDGAHKTLPLKEGKFAKVFLGVFFLIKMFHTFLLFMKFKDFHFSLPAVHSYFPLVFQQNIKIHFI